jgi:hypothetical protein
MTRRDFHTLIESCEHRHQFSTEDFVADLTTRLLPLTSASCLSGDRRKRK